MDQPCTKPPTRALNEKKRASSGWIPLAASTAIRINSEVHILGVISRNFNSHSYLSTRAHLWL